MPLAPLALVAASVLATAVALVDVLRTATRIWPSS